MRRRACEVTGLHKGDMKERGEKEWGKGGMVCASGGGGGRKGGRVLCDELFERARSLHVLPHYEGAAAAGLQLPKVLVQLAYGRLVLVVGGVTMCLRMAACLW